MSHLDLKINEYFAGKVVRKDLTKLVKGNAVVPTYVLEYLLGQYCATDDEKTILEGIERVKNILQKHYVHRDEANLIKSKVREEGTYRLIDKISVELNDKKNRYEADFSNLGLRKIPIADSIIRNHKKLLVSGVWSILNLTYFHTNEKDAIPWIIESLKPIQISNIALEEFKALRGHFTTEEWIDLILQTMGLNPEEFNFRSKLLQIVRLIPFVENNYNLIELGPKGTGKSHIYSELSPHGILVSGGEVSRAKLFINMATGKIGLVGYWDVVAYDEFAGKNKRTDQGMVDIMKNYMANKSFSRGTDVFGATASMVFVGNTDRSVPYMVKQSNLFEALPQGYYDTAFLDRIHCYLPGWEVEKLRNEMFSNGYGFVVDYLAEILKTLRKEDRTNDYAKYFDLSETITTRDKDAIAKTFAGLLKIIYPHDQADIEELRVLFEFAIEGRRRVKDQLRKMDETFEEVDFSYSLKGQNQYTEIVTLEEIQYLGKENIFVEKETTDDFPASDSEEKIAPPLEGKHLEIKDNQKGVSFKNLFGDYFAGATEVKIIDPYIRLPHQVRNLVELINVIAGYKEPDEIIRVELSTYYQEGFLEETKDRFRDLQDNLKPIGIDFEFEFDEYIHDRYILIDDRWKIVLGRGLDIWNKTGGFYDIAETNPLYRTCKGFSLTVVKMVDGG